MLALAVGKETLSEEILINTVMEKAKITGEESGRIIAGLRWLGMFSSTPVSLRGNLLDTLCATLEEKMQYEDGERDMVMLQHKFGIEWADGSKELRTSTGLWFGEPNGDSAMAQTVGIPCAITAQLILDGVITQRGVLAPMTRELCDPIMKELEAYGISMVERII